MKKIHFTLEIETEMGVAEAAELLCELVTQDQRLGLLSAQWKGPGCFGGRNRVAGPNIMVLPKSEAPFDPPSTAEGQLGW